MEETENFQRISSNKPHLTISSSNQSIRRLSRALGATTPMAPSPTTPTGVLRSGNLITSLTLRKRNMTNASLQKQLEILINAPMTESSPSTPLKLTLTTLTSPLMHLVELDLSRNRLSEISSLLPLHCPLLTKLNCQCNLFTGIPLELLQLSNLRVLNMSQNRITQLPNDLATKLPLLKSLKLDDNQITAIPDNFGLLSNLETLILGSEYGGNLISFIPEGVISGMKMLLDLDISHNRLETLPEDIGWSESKLTRFRCNNNFLSSIPRSLGQCLQLKTLDLSHNNICSLPIQIADLTSLELLDLTDNYLCAVPYPVDAFMNKTTVLLTANPFTTGEDGNEREQHLAKMVERRRKALDLDQEPKVAVEYEDIEDALLLEDEVRHLVEQRQHRETISRLEEDVEEVELPSPITPTTSSFDQDFPMFSRTKLSAFEGSLVERTRSMSLERSFDVAVGQSPEFEELLGSSPRDAFVQRVPSPAVRAKGFSRIVMDDDLTPVPMSSFFIPTLKELCARSVLQNQVLLDPADLPSHLLVYLLDGARPCSNCGGPYVKEYLAGIRTISTSSHGMIPRKVRYCSTICAEAHLEQLSSGKRQPTRHHPNIWKLNKSKTVEPSYDIEDPKFTVEDLTTLRRKSIAAQIESTRRSSKVTSEVYEI